jgi:Uma2 family endonuclease
MSDMAASTDPHVKVRPITVGEYHRMGEAGILRPHERVELLNGRIVEMPPIGPKHASTVTKLDRLLQATFGERAIVRSQQPLTLDLVSEPEPDILLVRGPLERYDEVHPTVEQALLVIEVSETTLAYDRGKKLEAYARLGVPEYWIVDLVHERIEIHREPKDGTYASRRIARRAERIAPLAFPNDRVPTDDILPPVSRVQHPS